MSTKIELEFFSVDEKLPEEQCDVMTVSKHELPETEKTFYLQQNVPYSPKHKLFNVYDRDTEEEAGRYPFRNVIAWAYQPDWSKVDV